MFTPIERLVIARYVSSLYSRWNFVSSFRLAFRKLKTNENDFSYFSITIWVNVEYQSLSSVCKFFQFSDTIKFFLQFCAISVAKYSRLWSGICGWVILTFQRDETGQGIRNITVKYFRVYFTAVLLHMTTQLYKYVVNTSGVKISDSARERYKWKERFHCCWVWHCSWATQLYYLTTLNGHFQVVNKVGCVSVWMSINTS